MPSAKAPAGPLKIEEDYMNLIEQVYHLTGQIPTIDYAVNVCGAERDKWSRMIKHPKFKDAMKERGIIVRNERSRIKNVTLTSAQLTAANTLLDLTDTRSQKKKLQDLGIPTSVYNKWLKDPIFQGYIAARSKQMILENDHEIRLALLDQIRGGNMAAITYLNEWTGTFTRASARAPVGGGQVDTVSMIRTLIEIVSKHVKDGEILKLISDDIGNMLRRQHAAAELVDQFSQHNVGQALTDPSPTTMAGDMEPRLIPGEVVKEDEEDGEVGSGGSKLLTSGPNPEFKFEIAGLSI